MKCPHCKKAPYPIKNEDGSTNWKNVFRIDPQAIVFMVCILIIIYGSQQINEQCFDVLEEPCEFVDQYECTGEYKQSLYYDDPIANISLNFNVT